MNDGRCTYCGNTELEQGWVTDQGEQASWIPGPLQRGIMGRAKIWGRRLRIDAYRCRGCGHLDLFAIPEG